MQILQPATPQGYLHKHILAQGHMDKMLTQMFTIEENCKQPKCPSIKKWQGQLNISILGEVFFHLKSPHDFACCSILYVHTCFNKKQRNFPNPKCKLRGRQASLSCGFMGSLGTFQDIKNNFLLFLHLIPGEYFPELEKCSKKLLGESSHQHCAPAEPPTPQQSC